MVAIITYYHLSLMEFTTRALLKYRRSLISGSDSPSGSISITLKTSRFQSFTEGIRTPSAAGIHKAWLAFQCTFTGNMLRTHGLRLFILYLNPNQALLTGAWGVEPRTYICCQGNAPTSILEETHQKHCRTIPKSTLRPMNTVK